MIKPPKTALLAAVVAASVGCQTEKNPGITHGRVGTVAMPVEEPTPETDAETMSEEVGKTADPAPPVKPVVKEPHKVGRTAKPDRKPEVHDVGTTAKPLAEDEPPKVGTEALPIGEEAPPAVPKPKPPQEPPTK